MLGRKDLLELELICLGCQFLSILTIPVVCNNLGRKESERNKSVVFAMEKFGLGVGWHHFSNGAVTLGIVVVDVVIPRTLDAVSPQL